MRVERTFFRDQRPCREYLRTVLRPGESGFVIRGTACRAGRAEWDILDEVVTEKDAPKKRAAVRPAPAPDAPSPERQAAPRPSATVGAAAAAGAPAAPMAEGPAVEEAPLLRKAKRLAAEAGEAPAPSPRFVPFTLPSRSAL